MVRFGRSASIVVIALTLLWAVRPTRAVEAWDAIYVGGQKVGHTHIRVEPVKDAKGRELVRVQLNTVASFQRGSDRVNMEMRYGTIETKDGAVLRLDTRTRVGREELRLWRCR